MRPLLLFTLLALPLAAQTQRFSFGLTGGVPFGRLTGSVPFGPDESRRYTFGVTMEAFLNDNVSLNFTPLYRRTGVRYGFVPNSVSILPQDQQIVYNTGRVRTNALVLPVIGKYTFRRATEWWRPFAGAGFAFQTGWQTIQNRVVLYNQAASTSQTVDSKYHWRSTFDPGAVFSAGVALRRGRVHYVPEIRFTRWGSPDTSHGRSQAEALFSIRF